MISRRQNSSGAFVCASGRRRRTSRVSGSGCFAPLVARLAAKHKMIVSQRRTPFSVINSANRVAAPISEPKPSIASSAVLDVSDEYVREKLSLFKDSMLAGLRSLRLTSPPQCSGFLPKEVQTMANNHPGAIPPTHMLAVYPSKPNSSAARTKVTLFPTHEIVLSAHCANFPKLPMGSSSNTIPVVPLALPAPAMYPYLQTYLYNKNVSSIENLLLPPSSSQVPDVTDLMKRLLAVHGLWSNATVLGVIDTPFYAMIQRVWASLHQTLGVARTSL